MSASSLFAGQSRATPWWLLVVVIAGMCLAVALVVNSASVFGRFIPTRLLEEDYLIGLLFGCALTLPIIWWPSRPEERTVLLYLWAARMLTTMLLMLVYENQYDFLDSYSYFAESRNLVQGVYIEDAAFGTRNVTYFFAGLWYVIPPSFHALKIGCAYLGLISIFLFYRAWRLAVPGDSLAPLWILGLTPSVLFWSSVLGKDPVVLLGIAIATWGVVRQRCHGGAAPWLAVLAGIAIMSAIRPWMGPILMGAIGLASLLRPSSPSARWAWLAIGVATVVGGYVLYGRFGEEIAKFSMLEALETVSSSWAIGGSAAKEALSFSSPADVLRFLPVGAFTALFRPLPGEIGGAFGLAAGAENLLLLGLMLWAAWRVLGMRWNFALLFVICVIALWTPLYAFLSYQNLGTAVRFKLQVMPFLMAFIGFAWAERRAVGRAASTVPAGAPRG
ncbi:MAG: hypothetical protein SXG53_06650 [Pseudomonadota bacterium]|nr:hypothetical protein [Pseudomonadota bacterium]